MQFRIRHWVIRLFMPLVWRSHRKHRRRILQEFAQTELDSAWQSIHALRTVSDARVRTMLFHHAIEELYHHNLLHQRAEQVSEFPGIQPLTRRDPILRKNSDKEILDLLAFLAMGESEIQKDFEVYKKAIPDPLTARLLAKIGDDEKGHADGSNVLLERYAACGGVSLLWMRVRHHALLGYKRYLSLLNKVGVIPMTFLLFVIYALFAGIFAPQARRKLATR